MSLQSPVPDATVLQEMAGWGWMVSRNRIHTVAPTLGSELVTDTLPITGRRVPVPCSAFLLVSFCAAVAHTLREGYSEKELNPTSAEVTMG